MVEKSKLISITALFILLGILLGIIRLFCVWTFTLLVVVITVFPSIAIIVVKWIFRDKDKPSRPLGFFVKTFTLFLISTGIAYFVVWLGVTAPYTYGVYPLQTIVEEGMLFVFLISLLLEAISMIIYGIYKIKLKPWEIFLSSWYVSIFAILVVYAAWLIINPPLEPENLSYGYTSFPPPALALLLALPSYSVIPAAVYTIIYTKYKKPA